MPVLDSFMSEFSFQIARNLLECWTGEKSNEVLAKALGLTSPEDIDETRNPEAILTTGRVAGMITLIMFFTVVYEDYGKAVVHQALGGEKRFKDIILSGDEIKVRAAIRTIQETRTLATA